MTGLFGLTTLFLTAIGLVVFIGLIQPVWAILNAANNQALSAGKKTLWILLCLSTWAPGGLVYGLFVSSSRRLRNATVLSLMLLVLLGAIAFSSADFREEMHKNLRQYTGERIEAKVGEETTA